MLSINLVHTSCRTLSSSILVSGRGADETRKTVIGSCNHCLQSSRGITTNRHPNHVLSTCINSNDHRTSLMVEKGNTSAPCSLCNHMQTRSLRYWWRGRNYPPNKSMKDHHFFYPPLQQQMKEREAINNPVEIIDIGLNSQQFSERMGIKTEEEVPVSRRRSRASTAQSIKDGKSKIELSSSSDLVSLVDVSIKKKDFNYQQFKMVEAHMAEGKEGLKELAHHYQIYRDLFSSPSQTDLDSEPLPPAKIPAIIPMTDVPHVEVLEKWFPGSLRAKPVPPRKIYHFTPHVPIYAEFAVNEDFIKAYEDDEDADVNGGVSNHKSKAKGKSDENVKEAKDEKDVSKDVNTESAKDDLTSFIASPVFNGNLVEPLYASTKPTVVIDARGSGDAVGQGETLKSHFESMEIGSIKLLSTKPDKLYTLMLLNLDTIFGDANPVCHWMVSNIGHKDGKMSSTETMSFLPIYGIRGLGYHRYVFLLYQHDNPIKMDAINSIIMTERQIEPQTFMKTRDGSCVPVGLSWFQSQWDSYSQHVFHHQLNMRSPIYEYIEPPEPKLKQQKYPVLAPFNVYLDHFRHPKELAEEALSERLKNIDPFNYEKNFEVDPLPNAYGKFQIGGKVSGKGGWKELRLEGDNPSWMYSREWKKRNRLGQWRALRPVSAKVPLNNHPDLDRPIWPHTARLELPNKYPDCVRRPKALRQTKWVLPPHQHPTYRIEHEDIHATHEELDKEE